MKLFPAGKEGRIPYTIVKSPETSTRSVSMKHVPDLVKSDGPIDAMKKFVLKRIVVSNLYQSLTGEMEDLKKLSKLLSTDVANPGLRAFLKGLFRDIEYERGMAKLFTRVGQALNPTARRKLVENLIYNWGFVGQTIREEQSTYDTYIPRLAVLSPSMKCNLNCKGCYSGLYEKDGELTEAEIEDILEQMRKLGMYFVVVSGGEPYLHRSMWLRLFRKFNDMYFLTYTNGTLIDKKTADELGRLGNVAPAISVEGYREETDERRGEGVYEKTMQAMDHLRNAGVLFGISVTYTRTNIDTITQDEFVKYYIDRGAIFAWYFMFMPVGKDPILDLVPTPEQRFYTGKEVERLRTEYPMFIADFWNDGPAAGGCLAGGRNYLHILNSGRVEPCVFAHFGVDNIREKNLLEAANSEFFKAIRNKFPYNENGNLKRPCMIIDNPQVLREVVQTYLVPQGHEHSEDLIRDPNVVKWIDRYAEEFRKLTDPVWEQQINDPEDRWYKNGKEYHNLFWFQRQAEARAHTTGHAEEKEPVA
jgi:MoaA/NifB/PqqE/SkfB family radical SAM enzyme